MTFLINGVKNEMKFKEKYLLALDIGNTDIVLGIINDENGSLCHEFRVRSDVNKEYNQYKEEFKDILESNGIKLNDFSDCIICSVVPALTNICKEVILDVIGIDSYIVSNKIDTDLKINVPNRSELGNDLFVCASYAIKKYKPPLIIFDLGTTTTVSVINKESEFIGCMIMPGIKISSEILSIKASLLPDMFIKEDVNLLETTTERCISSGIIYGHAAMIDGLIERIDKCIGEEATVIATGGSSGIIIPKCYKEIKLERGLIMEGLYMIYKIMSQEKQMVTS